jgi:hypothetical protein
MVMESCLGPGWTSTFDAVGHPSARRCPPPGQNEDYTLPGYHTLASFGTKDFAVTGGFVYQ